MAKTTTTKKGSKKGSKSSDKEESDNGFTTWVEFRSRRTTELKESDPDQKGSERQEQIREEWAASDENKRNAPSSDGE